MQVKVLEVKSGEALSSPTATSPTSTCSDKKQEVKEVQVLDDKEFLERTAKVKGTPLYCVDHGQIRRSCAHFKACFPNFTACYAIKANPTPAILKTVYQQGFGFDFASINEFNLMLDVLKGLPEDTKADFIKNKAIYAHPVKPISTLKQLDKYGILAVYDNVCEIQKIKEYAPHTRLILRISASNPASVYNLSSKFGCDSTEALGLIEAAMKEGLTVEGISFHIGSQSSSAVAYDKALKDVLKIFEEAAKKGIQLKKVDVGAGFPIPYGDKVCSLQDCANVIMPLVAQFPAGTQFLAEPGRVIVGECAVLVTKVLGKNYKKGKQYLYLDEGIYGVLSCMVADIKRPLIPLKATGELKPTVIYGPTCDCQDRLYEDARVPEMEIGDLFYVPTMGAYDTCTICRFNGMGDYVQYDHGFTDS